MAPNPTATVVLRAEKRIVLLCKMSCRSNSVELVRSRSGVLLDLGVGRIVGDLVLSWSFWMALRSLLRICNLFKSCLQLSFSFRRCQSRVLDPSKKPSLSRYLLSCISFSEEGIQMPSGDIPSPSLDWNVSG